MAEDFLCSALSPRPSQDRPRLRHSPPFQILSTHQSRIMLQFDFIILDAYSFITKPANTSTHIYTALK